MIYFGKIECNDIDKTESITVKKSHLKGLMNHIGIVLMGCFGPPVSDLDMYRNCYMTLRKFSNSENEVIMGEQLID